MYGNKEFEFDFIITDSKSGARSWLVRVPLLHHMTS